MKSASDRSSIIALVASGAMLAGCANLVVTDVRVNGWSQTTKSVTATLKNRCPFGYFFCRDAGPFEVYFAAQELPQSSYPPRLEVAKTVSRLDRDESIDLAADFAPLARAENNYLWNVIQVNVTADARHEVQELSETDNEKHANIPFSSELPIVIIDTLGGTIVDDPKIPASMKIIYDNAGGRNFITGPANDYNGTIGIELRGQLSSTFCKRQYAVETRDAGGNDMAASLLQLPAEEDWVLYGPYDDKSLMRNVLTYGVSNLLGRYASRTKFVELFLNDPGLVRSGCPAVASDGYVGVYVLVEKIKRDANRVNVVALTTADNVEPAVTGGYILKKDWSSFGDVPFTTNSTTGYGTSLTYVYPKCETTGCNATAAQRAWIEKYVNDFEAALKGVNFADPINGYATYIDVDSFVDYYLLEELFKNSDGFRGSTYMFKNRDAKLSMGPIWDMNFTMGDVGWSAARPPEGWLLGAAGDQMKWWNRLRQDKTFAQKVIDRWNTLRRGPFSTSNLLITIDNWASYLKYAQARNFKRWPVLGVTLPGNPTPVDPNEKYADAVQQMKTWLAARTTWIDNNIGGILPP